MRDKTLQAILDAMDLLATGQPARTDGKLTAANLWKEAGVSKATLYRYFGMYPDELKEPFEHLRRAGVQRGEAPESLEQENDQLKAEIKALRSLIKNQKEEFARDSKQKAHTVFILWKEVERLKAENQRLRSGLASRGNIIEFPGGQD